ncbi:MAG: hypothetical protein V9F03_01050 [Microthrixaceae bacterium]
MAQIVTRLDDDLAVAVDDLVEAGVVQSRSDAVRIGLKRLVDQHRRAQIGLDIVRGYVAIPQEDSESGWSDELTLQMISEESW